MCHRRRGDSLRGLHRLKPSYEDNRADELKAWLNDRIGKPQRLVNLCIRNNFRGTASVGMATLPNNIAVEVEMVLEVKA